MAFSEKIIKKMGYDQSDNLYWKKDFHSAINRLKLSRKIQHLLEVLNPYACYFVNEEPFVIFFDRPKDKDHKQKIHQKIWNAQIPVAIFDYKSHLEIYNGFSLNEHEETLYLVDKLKQANLNAMSEFSYWNVTDHRFWNRYYNEYSKANLDQHLLDNINQLISFLRNK